MSYKQIPNLPPIIAASSDMLFEAVQGGSSGKVSLDILFQFINDRVESYLVLPTRELFVARIASGHYDGLSNGWVVEAGGYTYRRVIGAVDIEDMPDWVPNGNIFIFHFASQSVLSANAQPAIRSALLYARTQVQDIPETPNRPGFAGHVSVNLGGGSWLVSNTVSMDQCAGVELIEGALIANTETFPAPVGGVYPYVLKFGGANNSGSRYMNVRNLTIECNNVANGVDCVNLQNGVGENINIHGQVQYGFRKYGPRNGACRFRNIRASEFWAGESGVGLRANRTSIGISDEAADEIWENCEGIYCLTNIYIKGFGAHRHIGGHPFHGQVTDIPTFTITDAVSDGSGGTRCTTAFTTGMTAGDNYVMPYITGITAVNNIGGRPGVYSISNVTSTTFDVAGYTFAGVFADSGSPKASRWADEMVNVLVDADVDTVDLDLEIDNGKVQVLQTTTNSPDVRMRLYGVGQNVASARVALELVSDGKTNADFGGVAAKIHTSQNGFRFVAINGGTVDIVPRCAINEFRSKKANRSTELLAVGNGSATTPSVHFTSIDDGDSLSITPNTGFFGKSDHTPALTIDGVEKLHFEAGTLLPKNAYAIANTITISELVTAASVGVYDDLPDDSVIYAGGYPFVKQAGAAYDRLPIGFIPRIPSPFAFRAVCNGVVEVVGGEAVLTSGTDDTAAIRALHDYCNVAGVDPNYSGTKIVCVQHNADIIINTDFDLKGAEIRLIGGMYGAGTFSHATIKTAFRAYDADCPIVTGTATVSDLNMVEGSVTPTADFFTKPGYVEIYANATNGPFVANRARTALDRFRQPFALNKDGVVTKPLARSMEGTGSVTYSYRKMPVGGRITISNFVVDAELFNNQTIFRLSRNNVNVINGTVRGEDLPALSQNQMFSVDYAAYITYHDIVAKAMGDPDESKSSYIFHSSHAAEITYSNCIALGEPWGASGQNNVSGIRWLNCTMNRLDVHQAGFNIEVLGGYVIGIGVGYGYGGGLLQLNGVTLVNCKVYHRSDWAGDWWGTIRLDNCTLINKSYEAIGFDAKDYSPLGSSLMATQVPNVVITNMTRSDRDLTASQISPYKIGLRAGSMPLIAPRQLLVDGVSGACEYRLSGGACMEDMILPAGISRRTEVSFANIQGCTGYTLDSDWTFKVPATSAVGPAIGAAGTITFSEQPAVNSTVTINGTVFTFVASGAAGNQCNIGANLIATLASLAAVLNASAVAGVAAATYSSNTTQLTVGYDMLGVAGNAFTLAASVSPASNGVVSAATLAGGAGHQYNLRISNSNEVAVDVTNSPGVRAYYSDIRLVANYMANNCITQMSDVMFGEPLLKPGFTAAPVCGALTSGTFNFGSIIGGRVEASISAWDFSNPRFISGIVISPSNVSCVYPFGATREDMFRGWSLELTGKNLMIRQSADRSLSAVTTSQPIFDEGGFSKVALVAGVYKFKLVYRVENMDAGAASNLRFDLKGAGSATLARILYDSAGRDATNLMTSAGALTGIMVAVESSLQLLNGVAAANAGGTLDGYFEVTADGTIQPSFLLAVGVAATVKEGTTFECTKIGLANVAGPWSA